MPLFVLGGVIPFLFVDDLEFAAFARVAGVEGAGIDRRIPKGALDKLDTDARRAEAFFQMDRFKEVVDRAPADMIEYAAAPQRAFAAR